MKSKFLSSQGLLPDLGLFILRLVGGGAMITHGWMKLSAALSGNMQFGDPIGIGTELSLYLAIFAEFACSILLILGLFTRLALIPLIITMLVAFFLVHGNDAFQVKELAFIYLGLYLAIFLTGPGKYSIDSKFRI